MKINITKILNFERKPFKINYFTGSELLYCPDDGSDSKNNFSLLNNTLKTPSSHQGQIRDNTSQNLPKEHLVRSQIPDCPFLPNFQHLSQSKILIGFAHFERSLAGFRVVLGDLLERFLQPGIQL